MGEGKEKFRVRNEFLQREIEIEALVDMGAVLPLLGRDIVETLGFAPAK